MPPHFLLYLLAEQPEFVRHAKLSVAAAWMLSQMAAAICLKNDSQLREACLADNTRHMPTLLITTVTKKLREVSADSLRRQFFIAFERELTPELRTDIEQATVLRDALAHGYLPLLSQIIAEHGNIVWTPRLTKERETILEGLMGSSVPKGGSVVIQLSPDLYKRHIEQVCRVMDFIATQVNKWGLPYAVFA